MLCQYPTMRPIISSVSSDFCDARLTRGRLDNPVLRRSALPRLNGVSGRQPRPRMHDRLPFRIGTLFPGGRVPVEDIPGVDDAREPGQDGQEDVDPKVDLEATVKEDSQGWDEDGEDEEDDVGSAEATPGNARGGVYRLLVGIGACCGRAIAGW